MAENVIDVWCCECKCLVLRETVLSEIVALGWSRVEGGFLCPNCTYYATRTEGGPVLLPPPSYSIRRPQYWDGKPGHWEGRVVDGKEKFVWLPNDAQPTLFAKFMCRVFGHQGTKFCQRCKRETEIKDTEPAPRPKIHKMTRYEKAKAGTDSILLYLSGDKRHIFGPDGFHLVKGLRCTWSSIADEEDVAEVRERFLNQSFELKGIAKDPRIKEELDRVSAKLMRDDPHAPGEK